MFVTSQLTKILDFQKNNLCDLHLQERSAYTPETRLEMQEVQEQMEEEKRQERADTGDQAADGQGKRARNLFMADGRPFNMNEGRLAFRLHDDRQAAS
jgi:hypothetical protein